MANPLMGMMDGSLPAKLEMAPMTNMQMFKQAAQSAKKMMGILQSVKNPQQALMMAAQQNSDLNSVLQLVGGRNPEQVFYEECQKGGINPEDILKELR